MKRVNYGVSINQVYVIIGLVILTGCSRTSSVVGTWDGNMTSAIKETITFNSDGTMQTIYKAPKGTATTDGNYAIKDNTITITAQNIKSNTMNGHFAINQPTTFTYILDHDKLTIKSSNGATILNRHN